MMTRKKNEKFKDFYSQSKIYSFYETILSYCLTQNIQEVTTQGLQRQKKKTSVFIKMWSVWK